MPKRFTDTEIWKKKWFINLSAKNKLAFKYVLENCDCIGVWDLHEQLANFIIKEDIDWEKLPSLCNENIEILPNGKWWLPDFCDFQYGELRWECAPHRKYIKELRKANLLERVSKGFQKGFKTLQEKEKEKEEEKEKEKEKDKGGRGKGKKFRKPTVEEIREYCRERNNDIDPQYFFDKNEEKGWVTGKNDKPIENWKATVRVWETNQKKWEAQNSPNKEMRNFDD